MAARGMGSKYQGSKWITHHKRLAIYLRDGLACCYCGEGIEDGATLSLDHITPHCQGGSNHETNLVTSCKRCNSSRGDRDVAAFVKAVAEYINHGASAKAIMEHIETTRNRALDVRAAKAMIERRGGYAAALATARV